MPRMDDRLARDPTLGARSGGRLRHRRVATSCGRSGQDRVSTGTFKYFDAGGVAWVDFDGSNRARVIDDHVDAEDSLQSAGRDERLPQSGKGVVLRNRNCLWADVSAVAEGSGAEVGISDQLSRHAQASGRILTPRRVDGAKRRSLDVGLVIARRPALGRRMPLDTATGRAAQRLA